MTHSFLRVRPAAALSAAVALTVLVGCAAGTPTASAPTSSSHDHAEGTEQSAPTPRLVVTYDGGLAVLDANSLETEATVELDGYNRVNLLGDGRHAAVSTAGRWAVLDAGTWSQPHGDHAHSYTAEPRLTDLAVDATTPGHVVNHGGFTAFFDDGTGEVTVVESDLWTHMVEEGHLDVSREYTTAEVHHGVAVVTQDNTMLVTVGDEESRTGAMLLDASDEVVAESNECPGVHGETAFTNTSDEELLMVGCEDGAAVFHDDHVHKISAPDDFGRIGNLFSSEGSDLVLGDYKTDPEGGIGLTQITLIDTAGETIIPVDPFAGAAAEYTWRGLARGAEGEVLVLGTDGHLRVLDPATGDEVRSVPVIGAWEVPEDWQTDHPALTVLDGMAYVTEPATNQVFIVDYAGGEVWKSADVGVAVNEIVGVTG
ncbi:MAG: hypothetical protein ACK5LS_10320 [Propioniciclava sp.]